MATLHKPTNPFQFWISLFPQAPLFGVEWQFAKVFPAAPWFNPARVAKDMASASVKEAVHATEAAVEAVVEVQAPLTTAMADAPAELVATAETLEAIEDETPDAAAEEVVDAGQPPAILYDTAPLERDDLKQLKGVGPKLEEMLNAMGIYRFDQIASFTPENLAWVDANLTTFKGRPMRDDWVAQAKSLC